MPLHQTSQKPTLRLDTSGATRSAGKPITADAAAFLDRHGDPATWTAEEFNVYLDLAAQPASPRPDRVIQ
ncbi:hypothetical protein T261_5841 [Streptomyces lydicus]|nr:hypothetical protein T261_5841 [Streptomyces lydicus]